MARLIAATLIAIGLLGSGWFVGHGFVAGRHDRFVSVKGLAERDVKADLALWPLRFVQAGNDLAKVQAAVQHDESSVVAFLKQHGIDEKFIVWRTLDVTDRAAQAYGSGEYSTRFIISRTLMVRSTDVDKLEATSQATSELVAAGVVLNNENAESNGPTYLFNGLTKLKPEMIAEATTHARAAAQQFAHDSGSQLAGIRTANQGLFEILPRDKAPMLQEQRQVLKTVRVVSTIDYSLAD